MMLKSWMPSHPRHQQMTFGVGERGINVRGAERGKCMKVNNFQRPAIRDASTMREAIER